MKNVLIVDDDADILEVVELILTIHDYNVKSISRASKIFTEIKKFKPDLILLDINIAGEDGREICKVLRTLEETQHIPVILFSAIPDLQESHLSCGSTDYLSKPFDVSELITKIEKHLNAA